MTFLSMLPSVNKNSEQDSNAIPQPLYTYLPGLTFLANLTPSNKHSFKVKSEFKSCDHVFNL